MTLRDLYCAVTLISGFCPPELKEKMCVVLSSAPQPLNNQKKKERDRERLMLIKDEASVIKDHAYCRHCLNSEFRISEFRNSEFESVFVNSNT